MYDNMNMPPTCAKRILENSAGSIDNNALRAGGSPGGQGHIATG